MADKKKMIFDIQLADKAFFEQLAAQNQVKFLEELKTLQLKYNIINIEKYMHYLKDKLRFPFNAYYTLNNGMFGTEQVPIMVNKFNETHFRHGLKCVCTFHKNVEKNISFHLIELDEGHEFTELINHYKHWYALKP